ncbi:MAG: MCE family protein [Alphaproteobacteria bacterium]|nr:MCE family protein [Alphaproteobacteria bacterium]
METKASYVVVGAFVLVLVAGLFGFVVWLARFEIDRELSFYYVYIQGSATGLQEGGQVRYRGVPIGRVVELRIDPTNVERIRAFVEISSDVPIKVDTIASLEFQGITGVAYIQLSGGTQAAPALEPKPGERYAEIQSRASRLEQVFDRAPELLGTLTTLMMQANDLVGPENREAFTQTLVNIRRVTGVLADRAEDIDRLISDTSQMSRELSVGARTLTEEMASTFAVVRGTTSGVDDQIGHLSREVTRSLRELVRTAEAFSKAADNIGSLAGDNRDAFREFANSGLYQFTQFVTEARELISGLSRVSTEIERDPRRFLFGDHSRGVEAR